MTGGAWVLFAAGWLGHWLWMRRYDLGDWLRDPDPLPSDREPLPALRSVRIVRRDDPLHHPFVVREDRGTGRATFPEGWDE